MVPTCFGPGFKGADGNGGNLELPAEKSWQFWVSIRTFKGSYDSCFVTEDRSARDLFGHFPRIPPILNQLFSR